MFCSSRTAWGLSSFITSATAIIPSASSPRAKSKGVFPSSASFSARESMTFGTFAAPAINFMLPPCKTSPSSTAESPLPGSARNSVTSCAAMDSSLALSITALARGCSLFASKEQASCKSSSSRIPSAAKISVTFGSPLVIVPVLSRATISIFPVSSRETAVLNIIPCFAPMPLPTIIATGVARPNAHGQLITRTEIPRASANPTVSPAKSQTAMVITEIAITAGTKTPDTRSATLAIGALVAAASLTI